MNKSPTGLPGVLFFVSFEKLNIGLTESKIYVNANFISIVSLYLHCSNTNN